MAKSLLPRTNREKALGIENTFPAWPNVEEGIKAKSELDLLIEEFKSNGGEEYLKESEEAKEVSGGETTMMRIGRQSGCII